MTDDEIIAIANRMVVGFLAARVDEIGGLLGDVLNARPVDACKLAAVFVATAADQLPPLPPGQTFRPLDVVVHHLDGTVTPGSAADLPAPLRTFAQMVNAHSNGDSTDVSALFWGFVGRDPIRACEVIGVGLGAAAATVLGPRCSCPPGTHP